MREDAAGESLLTKTDANVQEEAAGGNLTKDLPKEPERSLLAGEWLTTVLVLGCSVVSWCHGKPNPIEFDGGKKNSIFD